MQVCAHLRVFLRCGRGLAPFAHSLTHSLAHSFTHAAHAWLRACAGRRDAEFWSDHRPASKQKQDYFLRNSDHFHQQPFTRWPSTHRYAELQLMGLMPHERPLSRPQ
eukprot:6929411-Alexandrium_andersonii.AAC.1